MPKTKIVIWSVIVSFLFLPFALSASAAWYTCAIDRIGPSQNTILIQLTDTDATPAFQNTWFMIRTSRSKEMLAAGLTAVSMDKKIRVNIEGIDPFSDVTAIYLIND